MGLSSWLLNCFHPTLSTTKCSVQYPCFCCQAVLQTWRVFSTLPCTCSVLMSVPQSDSPADNCSSLSHLLFIRKAANYKLFSLFWNLSWLAWKEIPEPACHIYCTTRHLTTLLKRTIVVCCVFHFLNTKCSNSSTSVFSSAAAWVSHGLGSLASDRCHFRFNGHRPPLQTMAERYLPFHPTLLGYAKQIKKEKW